jgi:hypothetical protein
MQNRGSEFAWEMGFIVRIKDHAIFSDSPYLVSIWLVLVSSAARLGLNNYITCKLFGPELSHL